MTKWKLGITISVLVAAAGVLGYRSGRARADGVPAMQPLTYSGVLEESGSPVTGDRFIFVNLWRDATSVTATDRLCQTTSTTKTAVAGGWFAVDLDAGCTTAVNANPDLWVELIVEGVALPRTKLKAVPYALQAGKIPWSGITSVPADVAAYRTLTASIANDGSITRQDGTWVTSASNPGGNGGTWTVNFAAGAFSGVPTCTCSGAGFPPTQTFTAVCNVFSATATGLNAGTAILYVSGSGVGAQLSTYAFALSCTGPR